MTSKNKIIADYTPDRWVALRITAENGKPIYKVLSGWYGGYLGADEWRISSGITKVEKMRGRWIVHNESGSVYECFKKSEGCNSMMTSIFNKFQEKLKESIEIVSIEECLETKNKKKEKSHEKQKTKRER